jgi:hypothetical protein
MRLKPLLAAAVTAITVLAAAPAAHAGWMTGAGSLPVFRVNAVCNSYIDFEVGTYWTRGRLPVRTGTTLPGDLTVEPRLDVQPPLVLSNLGVWATSSDGELVPVVAPSDRSLPFQPLLIDPNQVGGRVSVPWPGPVAGQLTHTGRYVLTFDRWLPYGTPVRVGWGNWSADYPSSTTFTSSVKQCVSVPLAGDEIEHIQP